MLFVVTLLATAVATTRPSTSAAPGDACVTTCEKVEHRCETHKLYTECKGEAFRCSWATKFERLRNIAASNPCSLGEEVTSIKVRHHNGAESMEPCTDNSGYKCGMGVVTGDAGKCECAAHTTQNAHSLDNFEVGRVAVPYKWSGKRCQRFEFKSPFALAPRIVVTASHASTSGNGHHSVAVWTEVADASGFMACFRALNDDGQHDNQLTIDYFAWVGERVGRAEGGTHTTKSLAQGISCEHHSFDKTFDTTPYVVGSVDHTGAASTSHDAISTWLEGVSPTGFRVCFAESKYNSVGTHVPVKFHYLAFVAGTFSAIDASGRSAALVGAESGGRASSCRWISYGRTFREPPMVLATLNHHSVGASAKHDATQSWLEGVEETRFRFCSRESNNVHDGTHDNIAFVDWIAIKERKLTYEAGSHLIGSFAGKQCASFLFKKSFGTVPRITVMASHRTHTGSSSHESVALWTEWASRDGFRACWQEVNGDDKHAAMSLEYFAWTGDRLGKAHAGTVDAGSVTKNNRCMTQTFKEPFTTKPMVVGSIDHTGYTGADDHDALTSWIEDITVTGFRVCFADTLAYQTSGATGVKYHYVAFNAGEFPAADAHGRTVSLAGGKQITEKNNCVWIMYGKTFTFKPVVFASLNHHTGSPTSVHDGHIVWVENVDKVRFKLCMREAHVHGGTSWQHTANVWADWMAISNYDL
jgi:hypothetical protein